MDKLNIERHEYTDDERRAYVVIREAILYSPHKASIFSVRTEGGAVKVTIDVYDSSDPGWWTTWAVFPPGSTVEHGAPGFDALVLRALQLIEETAQHAPPVVTPPR